MDKELAHWDFDRVKQDSFDEWNRMLGRIEVEGGTKTEQIRFYTDLWHSLLGRRTISDADGKYMDMTGDYPRVREASSDKYGKPFPHYNFDALWGAQWSLNTLWGMAYPDIYDGFCNTLIDMYQDGGLIPRGPSGGNYTYVMIGDPAAWFIGSAYQKGIRTYDVNIAYKGLRKNAFIGGIRDRAGYEFRPNPTGGGMGYYIDMGYVPFDRQGNFGTHTNATTSMTLEYAFSDWCIAQMAKSLGKNDDYELFKKRSDNFKNVWNPKSGFMEPRLYDGQFTNDFNPFALGAFCESNSYIYTYFVPHNIKELARMMGGEKVAAERLDKQFENSVKLRFGRKWVDYSNEPGMGLGHVFNHLGYPWLTQYWIRTVQASFMDISPEGGYRSNDEDQGLMGSMHVLFSIGLFQLTSGADAEPFYEITTPIFHKITIHLNNDYFPGETFVIETKNNSAQNVYIHSAKLNGAALNNCWFYHKDFIKGGKLELTLSDKPNKKWGIGEIPVGK
jgi:predicted alpha-1,2-mannosidase